LEEAEDEPKLRSPTSPLSTPARLGGDDAGTILRTSNGGVTWTTDEEAGRVDQLSTVSSEYHPRLAMVRAVYATPSFSRPRTCVTGRGSPRQARLRSPPRLHRCGTRLAVGQSGTSSTQRRGATGRCRSQGLADLEAVASPDPAHCWSVVIRHILATTDGGAHWQHQKSAPATSSGVAFPDATHGWAVGGNDRGYMSGSKCDHRHHRRGAHWQVQKSVTNACLLLSPLPTRLTAGIGQGTILVTTTVAATGRSRRLARNVAHRRRFPTPTHGWAVGATVPSSPPVMAVLTGSAEVDHMNHTHGVPS